MAMAMAMADRRTPLRRTVLTCAVGGGSGGRSPASDPERYKERNTVERCFTGGQQLPYGDRLAAIPK
jgi:hypothetical protein